ncbi:MAG: hypothetical protein M1818_003136 [Claussenomyces sp. TS43310]|nr:MAG: hypothetical protein M1818_003136 [Claussenomyces sp. TS43310]
MPQNAQASAATDRAARDLEVSAAFKQYYMQKIAEEFAEDLDRIRGADDFHSKSLQLLLKIDAELFQLASPGHVDLAFGSQTASSTVLAKLGLYAVDLKTRSGRSKASIPASLRLKDAI